MWNFSRDNGREEYTYPHVQNVDDPGYAGLRDAPLTCAERRILHPTMITNNTY